MKSVLSIESVKMIGLEGILLVAFAFSIILSIAVAQLLLAVLAIFGLYRFARGQRVSVAAIDVALMLFLVARVISVLVSSFPETSMRLLSTEIPMFLTYFVIRFQIVRNLDGAVRLIVAALIAGAMIASLWGSAQVLLGYIPRAASLTSGYYTLGTYLTANLALVLFLGRSSWFNSRRWLWFSIAVGLLIGIVLTMNRIHWGIAALLILTIGIVRERKLLGVAIAMAIAAVLIVPGVAARLEQSIHFASNLSDRDWLWKGAIQLANVHPWFGFGPQTFRAIFPYLNEIADKGVGGWHNDYLQVYIESGVIGLLSFIGFLAATLRNGIRIARSSAEKSLHRELCVALLAALVTVMLSALTGRALLDLLIVMLQGVLIALLVSGDSAEQFESQSKS